MFPRIFTTVVADVDQFIVGTLSETEKLERLPEPFKSSFAHCWRIPLQLANEEYVLLLLLDSDFPFSQPKVALEDGPRLLEWPHLEKNSLLCLLPDQTTVDWAEPVRVVKHSLSLASELVSKNVRGELQQDFRDEFLSYWGHACVGNRTAVSLVEPCSPSRSVAVYHEKGTVYFGENASILEGWYEGRFQRKIKGNIEEAWMSWLEEPWLPSQYPNNPKDLCQILTDSADHLLPEDIANMAVAGYSLLVGGEVSNGCFFAAVQHIPPVNSKQRGPRGRSTNPIQNGFRPGKVAPEVAINRGLGAGAKIERLRVARADHSWIHGRDQDKKSRSLSKSHVCMAGAGSLGSEVASMLAKSGVGRLSIADRENLDWPNISRHLLGAKSVKRNKAVAVANTLSQNLPHLEVVGHSKNLSRGSIELMEECFDSDLLIMVTGDWVTNVVVNEFWLKRGRPVPIVLAWMEPHALVTHCVSLSQDVAAGCMLCGFDNKGRPLKQVFEYSESSLLGEPACGGQFSPYGAISLTKSAAFVAENAVDTLTDKSHGDHLIQFGSNQQKINVNANWAPTWSGKEIELANGGATTRIPWPKKDQCAFCGGG